MCQTLWIVAKCGVGKEGIKSNIQWTPESGVPNPHNYISFHHKIRTDVTLGPASRAVSSVEDIPRASERPQLIGATSVRPIHRHCSHSPRYTTHSRRINQNSLLLAAGVRLLSYDYGESARGGQTSTRRRWEGTKTYRGRRTSTGARKRCRRRRRARLVPKTWRKVFAEMYGGWSWGRKTRKVRFSTVPEADGGGKP